ncbi:MAG: DUF302 domain-containing protein [Thermodesulfobacteriales bacterium]|nr:MAG: DUF302 domain-containing protein [Thermodesulfobacteriales bacterium]
MLVRNLSNYSFGGETKLGFDDTVAKVEEVLKEEGFGVLTEIDAKKVLKEKLGLERRPYKILGACNPNFAHRAIDMEPDIGTLLPCNVVVYEKENGKVMVSAMNPEAALSLVGNPDIEEIAKEVRNRIEAALEKL